MNALIDFAAKILQLRCSYRRLRFYFLVIARIKNRIACQRCRILKLLCLAAY